MLKQQPQPEDRIITVLEIIRNKLVETITEIDSNIEYLERTLQHPVNERKWGKVERIGQ